jgi:hypothetical protein
LRKIFGDSVDYEAVRIKEGHAGLFSANDRAFTSGNTIYMKGFRDDPFTTDRMEQMPVLVSEMTHIWQYQNGGARYASRALLSQRFGAGTTSPAACRKRPGAACSRNSRTRF